MRILGRSTATLRRLLDAVLIGLIVLVLFGVVLGKVVPLTGRQTIIVGGKSMEPAIGLGSAVVIAPVAANDLRPGDVVSLRAGEDRAMYTHRIVAVVHQPDGIYVRTKGDANEHPDPTAVPVADIVGRVELTIPLAGYLIALLSIPTGVLFLIGLAATLLAAVWLLESLELDRVDRRQLGLPAGPPTQGEPIAARKVAASLAATGGYGDVRLTVAEQLALSREIRRRRDEWQAADQERADHPAD
jgi:signal peptidase I